MSTAAPAAPRPAVAASAEAPAIDHENPWPGLVSFPEAAEAFFNGRDAERDDLLRLIGRETLTLLYGLSGLGKSSLLSAGLFPVLRQERFLPVYVRLDHAETSPPHDEQLRGALLAECARRGVEAPAPRPGEGAWELLHRADGGFWDARNYPVTPVLVIDQFEEIFTLGMATPQRQARSARFMAELGDLIDNRPPDALVRRLDADPDAAADYAFSHPGCKIVLSMREDFLAELGHLREHTRSTFQNYLRLLRMRGDTAAEAIVRTGGRLVDRQVARAIVCFLARVPAGQADADLSAVEVEPALLSLVCRELNERRRDAGLEKIDIGLLDVSQTEILARFYRESFEGMRPGMRVFVEEELLTETGYRDAAAMDDALRLPDVSAEAVDALVARRLIRKEERFGTARIELTHDVLTDVVRESRDRRRAEEEAVKRRAQESAERARKRRMLAAAAGVVLLLFIAAGGILAGLASAARTEARAAEDRARGDSVRLAEARSQSLALQIQKDSAVLARQTADLLYREANIARQAVADSADLLATKRDSLTRVVAQMEAARSLAGRREQEALVGAERQDFVMDRLVRRSGAQAAALDSTANRTVARADSIMADAARLAGESAQLQAAVAGVLCGKLPEDDPRARVRAALDSVLVNRSVCDPRAQRSAAAGSP